jgi:hypothetical protein
MEILTATRNRTTPASGMRNVALRVLILLSAGLLWFGEREACAAETASPSEEQIKAAFIVNFPKYVEWSPSAFPSTNSPVIIATLGEGKVVAELQKMIVSRTVNGRSIVLKSCSDETLAAGFHILFVSSGGQQQWNDWAARLDGASVLTVGENEGFLENRGMIHLARRDRKVSLEINLNATTRARLKLSSKLLSVAGVVKGRQD